MSETGQMYVSIYIKFKINNIIYELVTRNQQFLL